MEKKPKRTIELLANNTNGALELKESLEKKGLKVVYIYTGVDTPMVIDNGNYYSGLGNIRVVYELYK
ncbi:MAG TPA: hypothetical protein PK357_02610 [Candidatus Pacearchaeota archaeon]|nr:hypothetical protein [Candidatus Pacearchaeota archaeon]